MAELVIFLIGLAITGFLALLKVVFTITALTWFWVWVPTLVAIVIAFGCMCGLDFD